MNRQIALALLLSAAGAVHADDITPEPPFTPTLSRAEVIAQMQQFRRSANNPWADEYNQLATFQGARTRAEVRAAYIADRAAVAAFGGEDSGSMYLAHMKPIQPQQTQLAVSRDADKMAASHGADPAQ